MVVCIFLLHTPSVLAYQYIMDGTHYYPKQELYIDFEGDEIVYTTYCGSHDCIEYLERRDKNNPLLANEIQELQLKGFTKVIDSTNTAFLTEKPTDYTVVYVVFPSLLIIVFGLGVIIYVKRRKNIRKAPR